MSRGKRISLWILGGVVLLGLIAFWVMFLPPFRVAETFAEPTFCGSCHEMEPWLASFEESDHQDLESCNDCHLPHGSVVEYYFWEGVVGVRDLVTHSVGAIPDPIEARDRSRDWAKENCLRCHADEIEEGHGEEERYCWTCHDDVFHKVDQDGDSGGSGGAQQGSNPDGGTGTQLQDELGQ